MKAEIVEAKPFHCGQMARMLRPEQGKVLVRLGVNSHRALRTQYDHSAYARAYLGDGRLACLWGVDGTLASAEGHLWMALATWVTPHARQVARLAREQIGEMMKTRNSLRTLILIEDKASFRFAQHLGFHVMPDADTPFETVMMEI